MKIDKRRREYRFLKQRLAPAELAALMPEVPVGVHDVTGGVLDIDDQRLVLPRPEGGWIIPDYLGRSWVFWPERVEMVAA